MRQYHKGGRRAVLSQLEDMNREFRDISHHMAGRLKLGFSNERIIYMLPLILAPFKKLYPRIDVEVVTGPGNRLIESLRNGGVDFVFLPTWRTYKDIAQMKVFEEELVLVAAGGYLSDEHFLDREKRIINWRTAAALPLITLKKGHVLRDSVDVLYKNAGVKPPILLESHSNMLSYRLAAQGLGITVVPEITVDMMSSSMEVEVCHLAEAPLTWEVFALYREGCYLGESEKAFLDTAKSVLNVHNKWL